MRIHKAWYGPKGGHSLLASSAPELLSVFRQAAWLTDLPGTAPTGLLWDAYFRTAIYEGYFVLIHTRSSRDTTRAGMVDSVAAFIPLTELADIPDFIALANNLRKSHDSVEYAPFVASTVAPVPAVDIRHPLLLDFARVLISGTMRPAIHVGQSGFDEIMLELLQVVPPLLRKEILFSLSFTVEDAANCFAVCIPSDLASRYPQKQLLSASNRPPEPGVAALLNMPEGRPILDFAADADFDLKSPASLVLLERAFQMWEQPAGVSDAIGLVRLLANKSGDSQSAKDVRNSAMQRLIDTSSQWTPSDILAMRNLPLEKFEAGGLSESLKDWIRKRVDESCTTHGDCQLFAQAVQGAAQQAWWNADILAGYSSTVRLSCPGIGTLAWLTMDKVPESLLEILKLFDANVRLELLTDTVFLGASDSTIHAVAEECARLGAWKLCGIASASRYNASEALHTVLNFHPPLSARRLAIESSLKFAVPSELIEIAVREDIDEVTALAAEVVKQEPSFLRGFSWTSPVWFDILASVVTSNPKARNEIENIPQGLQTIIHLSESSERVWGALARADFADLSQAQNRAKAWALIPDSLLGTFTTQTARAWLAAMLDGTVSVSVLEEPLLSEVKSLLKSGSVMASLAHNAQLNFIKIIDTLYPESDIECASLLDSLACISGFRLPSTPAAAMGKLIQSRKWKLSASRAASHSFLRVDFLAVAKECLDNMGIFDSWSVAFRIGKPVDIPVDEAWKMLEITLAELYPQGPTDQAFWSRSGGKDNQLVVEGNGVAQWHRCIKQVRAGQGPSASDLLNTASLDFSGNLVLKMLQERLELE